MDEETLKAMAEAYGNARHQIELETANYKTQYQAIIAKHPELKLELESLEEELGNRLKEMEKTEALHKKMLQDAIESYARDAVIKDKLLIKTKLVTVTIKKGEVVWDANAMDMYALEHPKILSFRDEKPATSRIALNKV